MANGIEPLGPVSIDGYPGEISIFTLASELLKQSKRVLVVTAMFGILGLATGIFTSRLYSSSASFLPQGNQGGASGFALAASQLGINVPNASGFWVSGLFVELLNSRTILGPIARDTFAIEGAPRRRVALMDYLGVGGSDVDVRTEKAVKMLQDKVISVVDDKKLGIVRLTVSTTSPKLSQELAQRLVDAVNQFNVATRKSQAQAEREFIDTRLVQVEMELRGSENSMQAFLSRNRTLSSSPELAFERERLQRDLTLRQQVYATLVQSREDAKIREVRDTPVITIVEEPQRPVLAASRRLTLRVGLGMAFGFAISLAIVFLARDIRALPPGEAVEVKRFLAAIRTGLSAILTSRRQQQ